MDLTFADLLIVSLYIVFVLIIGFRTSRKSLLSDSAEDFILAGRKITLPFFVASLVATWYGGILGYGEFVYTGGLVAWVCFGLPYYIAAILFALILAKKIRLANVTTIPEQITLKYGNKAGNISTVIVLVITIPASYILMLSILIQLFTGWTLFISVLTGTALSMIYLFTGGYKASVLNNTLQFVLMFLGFGALVYFSYTTLGSFSEMGAKLPESHLTVTGPFNWQYVAAWYIIAFQTFVDPSFHQRCSSAETPETARKGVLISIIFWILFDALQLFSGFYAKAFIVADNALMAFPMLGDLVLPSIWKGIFLTAMIASVMSTIDTYAFLSGATIGNDILKPILGRRNIFPKSKMLTRIGLIITAFIAIIMATLVPSVVQLIYLTSSIAVPGLLAPLVLSMSTKYYISQKQAVIIMLMSSSISAAWIIFSSLGINFFVNLEPMFPGIVAAIVLTSLFVKRVRTT